MSQKVLVVEDDSNIAELLRLYLQKDGFEVSHAADGGKAVEMAKEIQPDLVLLDIMLPVMDGWQVCRELRKSMKMPIIMLTAKGETEDKVSGLEMGADDYIVTTEFNLYAETAHFQIWLRLITRERDYNLYTYFFAK